MNRTIPRQFGSAPKLEELDLSDNELTGELPTEFGNLATLKVLKASENSLRGQIPSELGQLKVNLGILQLSTCILRLRHQTCTSLILIIRLLDMYFSIEKVITDFINKFPPNLEAFQPSRFSTWVCVFLSLIMGGTAKQF